MRALVIGGAGFVGHHLVTHLLETGWEVYATKMPNEIMETSIKSYAESYAKNSDITSNKNSANIVNLDILDAKACKKLLKEIHPQAVFHLAAQSSVAVSWKDSPLTMDVNIKGTLHLLEALRELENKPRVLLIGSSEEYGNVSPEMLPISETMPICPINPYAISKATQGMFGRMYADIHGLEVITTRSFNHIGPGQSETFAIPSFCKQIAEIEIGLRPPVLKVGNLSAKRDFTDVRDIVRAYETLIEKGKSGEVYNVGSGKALAVQSLLDTIIGLSTAQVTVEQDPERMRPSDMPEIAADIKKLQQDTNWVPVYSIRDTLCDILEYWRKRLEVP